MLQDIRFAARQLLARYGVVFKRLLERERIPVRWRDLVRAYRRMELRGDVRGGRFVQRFAGEQYALPQAVELMRRLRRRDAARPEAGAPTQGGEAIRYAGEGARVPAEGGIPVAAADPLNLAGILTPDPRIPATPRRRVLVAAPA